MSIAAKGATVYLSASDIEALHHAQDHLSTLLESAGVEVPELIQALAGVHAILDKTHRVSRRRNMVAKALKVAAEG